MAGQRGSEQAGAEVRRVTVVLLGALLGLGAQTGYPAVAAPDPAACQQYNSHGICVVQAESAEQPATRPIATASGNGDGRQEALCTLEPTGDSIPCQEGPSWWVQSLQCYAQLMPEQPSKDSPIWGGRTDGAIYVCTYYTTGGAFPGTNGFSFWSATAPAGPAAVDPAVLAEEALRTLTIPAPTTGRYPAGTMQDGQPFTVVNAYTWFWTDPGAFRALTARGRRRCLGTGDGHAGLPVVRSGRRVCRGVVPGPGCGLAAE